MIISLLPKLNLPTELLDPLVEAAGLGGQPLTCITHRTKPVRLKLLVTIMNSYNFSLLRLTNLPSFYGFPGFAIIILNLIGKIIISLVGVITVWLTVSSLLSLLFPPTQSFDLEEIDVSKFLPVTMI